MLLLNKTVCLSSWMRQVVVLVNKKLVAWGIILLFSALFLLPYTFHGLTIWTLGPYSITSLLPITVGSLLRARDGALVAWFLTMCGLLVMILAGLGSSWPGWQLAFPCIAITDLLIALVAGQLRSLGWRLQRAYTKLEEAHATIQRQAVTDGLTGLPNHGAIVEQIEAELLRCQGSQRNCAIIFVDVDHFKRINDTLGHAAGDAALHEVGQRLRQGMRRDDSIGRYGGEEFAILLSGIEQSEAFNLAERLRSSIAEAPCLWQQKRRRR